MEVKTYTQTLEFLRSYIEPVASTAEKAISEALGFVLAEDLHSPIDLPLLITQRWTAGLLVRKTSSLKVLR